jgi:Bacterial SH3 domain/Peptidase M15
MLKRIRELVSGATVEIDTPIGTKLPVRYMTDGRLSGQARDLASYLGAASDTGRWWIAADQLCHKWSRWFDSEPQCLRLSKEGRTIHWRSQDGNSGTAVIAVPAPVHTIAAVPRAQVETKMHVAAAETMPAPSGSVEPMLTPVADPPTAAENTVAIESLSAATLITQPPNASSETSSQQPIEPKRAAASLYMVANVNRDDVLNVRNGPSAESDVIGELQPGSRGVSITGACRSQWCPVQHESTSGWVNRMYLANEAGSSNDVLVVRGAQDDPANSRDSPDAPRTCLTQTARALLERIEEKFGPVKLVSTCRPGATIAGSGRPSRHASGNAVDFDPGSRKGQIVEWLIANHHDGGTMTYADMDHIHVDIGPHFVSIAGGQHWASWRDNAREFPRSIGKMGRED